MLYVSTGKFLNFKACKTFMMSVGPDLVNQSQTLLQVEFENECGTLGLLCPVILYNGYTVVDP